MSDPVAFEQLRLRGPRPMGPWTSDLLARVILGNAAGLILIAAGCWQVSGGYSEGTQIAWMVAVLAGLGVAGLTNGLWLLRGLQSVGAARDLVVPAIRIAPRGAAAGAIEALVVVHGGTRVHLAGCVLARGKRTAPITNADEADLPACAICLPAGARAS